VSRPGQPGTARRWLPPAALALAVLAAGAVIALLQPAAQSYLSPNGTGSSGGHALAALLAGRGQQVISAPVPRAGSTADVELITSPGSLSGAQLAEAGRFPGDIVLVGPTPAALRAIAPGVSSVAQVPGVTALAPLCDSQSANLAGAADLGGAVLETAAPGARACYPADGGYFMVALTSGGRTVDVLGSGAPLTNQYLADQGNAALALNLLRGGRQVIWVVPGPGAAAQGQPGTAAQRPLTALVPWPAYLVLIQLGVAVLLAAAWRARRLGPLVAERLPVVVRASETVEGHGRLYQARRARDRAAAELRQAARARISRLAGLAGAPAGTGPPAGPGAPAAGRDVSPAAIAARTGDPVAEVAALLYGPAPRTDAGLVSLAAELDTLERKVRQS
jgi:hypothetical protein